MKNEKGNEYFYMVYLEGKRGPAYKHDTIESAEREAKRLSEEFEARAYVLCSLKSYKLLKFDEKDNKPINEELPF